MLYRKFGKTNEKVSILGFGCMRLPILPGGDPSKIDETEATKLIRHAIDSGVNYIDTAYPYHGTGMGTGGQSEPFVGKALKDGYREKVKLATKLPSWLIKSREDMDKYLSEQLNRLQTDYIDFYLVHALTGGTWEKLMLLGIRGFLDQAITDGRIKYAGFSFHDKGANFKPIVDSYDWSFCQIQLNYMDEEFQAGMEGLKYATGKGLGVTIMEPLRGGKLAFGLPQDVEQAFAKADGRRSPAEWALRWVWNNPEVTVALSGMNTMEQVDENMRVAGIAEACSLTEAELGVFDKVKRIFRQRTKVGCTACGYCMPCPVGVSIPSCFSAYNNYYVYGRDDSYAWVPQNSRASKCVECGKCETHCPQGIAIRKELKKVKQVLETV